MLHSAGTVPLTVIDRDTTLTEIEKSGGHTALTANMPRASTRLRTNQASSRDQS